MTTLLLGFAFITILSVTLNVIFMMAHIKNHALCKIHADNAPKSQV